jgi:hypothetical protein
VILVWSMWLIHTFEGNWSIIGSILLLLQHVVCIASFILHWKLCRVPKVMTVPVQHLGCSSIPYWVCRQKTYYIAFIEVLADVVGEANWLYTSWWGCSRGDGIWYIISWILYSEVFLLLIEVPFKLLINSTCGLNSLSKQFTCWDVSFHPRITQCRYSIHVMGIGK